MLKFLRKYQKWMLVVFCGALMVAFLIPQAVSQFAPNEAKRVIATTYDGQSITNEEIRRVYADLEMLRRLGIEQPLFTQFGLTLLPQTGSERDDALAWILIQRAAEHNGLGASQQEAFNLVASVLGMEDFDSLDERAKELNASAGYLIELGRQYLAAEQYRQLVSAIEYDLDEGDDAVGSPGLRRVIAMNDAVQAIQQSIQQFAQLQQSNPQMMQQLQAMAINNVMIDQGYLDKIQGHERFSAAELRYALQRQFAELDLTVVVLDAEDRLDATVVDDAYIQGIFERFADDEPGTGEPYGLGYREPDKAQLEAIRIPIDAVREKVAQSITPEDVRAFYNENKDFLSIDPTAGEEADAGPVKLTPDLRDQIRLTLTEMRSGELAQQIAQQARLRLNEDARGLPSEGIYKQLPDDFQPTPLTVLVDEIQAEHGVLPEIITVDDFVSAQDINDTTVFTLSWLRQMPTATLKLPDPQFGFLRDMPISQTVLGGRAGLFASEVPAYSQPGRQSMGLAGYLTAAKPFLDDDQREQLEQANVALQVGMPGQTLRDATGSTYVFRITKVQPSRPAPLLAPIAEQVAEDALKVKAYEDLVAEEDVLLKRAADQSIEALMQDADAKNTLTGLTRDSINQPFGNTIEGVDSSRSIIERAFQVSEDLLASGGIDQAEEADLLFAVEVPGNYKLVLVRIDKFRPMTKARFEEEAARPASLALVTNLGATERPEPAFSFESLQRYTGFKWAEGFGPDEEGEEGDEEEEGEEGETAE